jgi:hypothetical protein
MRLSTNTPRRFKIALTLTFLCAVVVLGAGSPLTAGWRSCASSATGASNSEQAGMNDIRRGDARAAMAELRKVRAACGVDCAQYKRLARSITTATAQGG